jgi:hypothetical protein
MDEKTIELPAEAREWIDRALSFHGQQYDYPEAEEGNRMKPEFYEFVGKGLTLRGWNPESIQRGHHGHVTVMCLAFEYRGKADAVKSVFKDYKTVEELERRK